MAVLSRLAPGRWHPLALVLLLVGCPIAVLHAVSGTPDGFSAYYNLAWAEGFDAAFWGGDAYPRRLDTLVDGTGGLDFFFYGPAPFWLNSTIGRLLCGGCSATAAFPLTGALLIVLSGAAFYPFARCFAGRRAAALGAGAYMLLPYHMLADWWLRQAVGEIAAFVFIPLVALGMKRILDRQPGFVLFTLSLAGLVLSHLPSTMVMAYFLAAYGAVRAWQARGALATLIRPVARLAGAGALGLALSAIYWLPAISLLGDVSPDLLYTAYGDPLNWLFLDGRAAPNTMTAEWTGTLYLAALAVAVAAYVALKDGHPARLDWVLGPIAFGLFMTSVLAAPIWAHTPIAAIQFPWRTLMVVDLGVALAITGLADQFLAPRTPLSAALLRRTRLAALTVAVALCVATVLILPTITRAADNAHRGDQAPIPTGALEYIPAPFLTKVREAVDALPDPAPGTSPYRHWHEGIRTAADDLRAASADSAALTVLDRTGTRQINIRAEREKFGEIVLPYPHWQHWQAINTATGEPIPLLVHEDTGGMVINGGPGPIDLRVVLAVTPAERLGGWLSGLSALLLLAMAIRSFVTRWPVRTAPLRSEPA
ncbi:MAG: hypothetical protein AAF253_04435 [Pseudomonadota bacterium]